MKKPFIKPKYFEYSDENSKQLVLLSDYNPKWSEVFIQLKKHLQSVTKEMNLSIEHVGSTSVIGLAAKPIIDILIVMQHDEQLPCIIEKLEPLGYQHEGDLGVKGREAFKHVIQTRPFSKYKSEWPYHHLYAGLLNNVNIKNMLRFRDILRTSKYISNEYSQLKKELALKYKENREKYTEAKTAFINKIINENNAT